MGKTVYHRREPAEPPERGDDGPQAEKQEGPALSAPNKRRARGKLLWYAAAGACLLVLSISAAFLISYQLQYKKADSTYQDILQAAVVPVPQGTESAESGKTAFNVDFDKLAAINPDVAAWIVCEGTEISYPVVQGTDNAYYLSRLFDNTYNPSGTLFVDCRAQGDFAGQNTVIYGHNMRDGSMFSSLESYSGQAYYDKHPAMRLYTRQGEYTLEIFAAYVAADTEDAWQLAFAGGEDLAAWAARAQERSSFTSNVKLGPDDSVVTLSTCVNGNDEVRYVVMGRLVPVAAGAPAGAGG